MAVPEMKSCLVGFDAIFNRTVWGHMGFLVPELWGHTFHLFSDLQDSVLEFLNNVATSNVTFFVCKFRLCM